ncbi:MAG: phage holin family protein [Oligoflexia bacterium]|nr:phage holin family protein [Oligoflexia bacterium]
MANTQPSPEFPPNEGPYSQIMREIAARFQDVIRSELRLARAESKDTLNRLGRRGAAAAIFAVLAIGGLLPLLAFLVIGLGKLLGGNYWLSSMIVGTVMVVVGGLLARRQLKAISAEERNLPRLRESLRNQRLTVETQLETIAEKRRSA